MKIIIDIPNYEFDNDVKNKFQDYFSRVRADLRDYPSHDKLCGNYEMETTDMFLASFKRLQVLPDNATNGDMIKTMFPNISVYEHGSTYSVNNEYNFNFTWWNAPYKRGDSLVNGEDKRLEDSPFVEIGMCKNCKRYNKNEMFCTWHRQKCDPDYYCANFESED